MKFRNASWKPPKFDMIFNVFTVFQILFLTLEGLFLRLNICFDPIFSDCVTASNMELNLASSLSQKRRILFMIFSCFNKVPNDNSKFLLQKRSVQKGFSCLHNALLRFKFTSASGVASQIHNSRWNVWRKDKSLVKSLCEKKNRWLSSDIKL